ENQYENRCHVILSFFSVMPVREEESFLSSRNPAAARLSAHTPHTHRTSLRVALVQPQGHPVPVENSHETKGTVRLRCSLWHRQNIAWLRLIEPGFVQLKADRFGASERSSCRHQGRCRDGCVRLERQTMECR